MTKQKKAVQIQNTVELSKNETFKKNFILPDSFAFTRPSLHIYAKSWASNVKTSIENRIRVKFETRAE